MVLTAADLAAVEAQLTTLTSNVEAVGAYAWLLYCTALVLFMQCGFALVESGTCRSQNVLSIMMKNQADCIISILSWFVIGRAMAYGDAAPTDGWIGTTGFFQTELFRNDALQLDVAAKFHFNSAFCSVATTIVSGGIAERTQLTGYLVYSSIMSAFLYPVVVCWCWNVDGWIKLKGFYDFAGSCVVHLTGGIGALCGAIAVGPRQGRFSWRDEKHFAPHSVPFIQLGTLILWFGWYGFNAGSVGGFSNSEDVAEAILASINTTLGAASGGFFTLVFQVIGHRKYSVPTVCNGMLVGLVSITAGCAVISPWSAIAVSAVGALLYMLSVWTVEAFLIDDPVGAFSVHGIGGLWGILAVPIFHRGVNAGGRPVQQPSFQTQALGAAMVIVFVGIFSGVIFKLIVLLGLGKVSAHGQSSGDETRYETMAYANVDSERYSTFICHAKDSRGACARWLQLELSQYSGSRNKIFLDSDNLVNLSTLLRTVREKVDVLVLMVSDDVWHRPWCAGEISSAYMASAPVVLVCIDDSPTQRPPMYFKERRDEVQDSFSQRDLDMLASYDISRDNIERAYEDLKQAKQIHFSLEGYVESVRQVAEAALLLDVPTRKMSGCMRPQVSMVKDPAMSPTTPRRNSLKGGPSLLILGDTSNVEAVAAMHICRHGLLEAGCEDDAVQLFCAATMLETQVLQLASRGSGIILVLSKGVLQCRLVQQVLLLCAAQEQAKRQSLAHLEKMVVLIHADRLGFEFPSQDFQPELYASESEEAFAGLNAFALPYESDAERCEALEVILEALFKLIALPLSTHGSWHSMQHQLYFVYERMHAVEFVSLNPALIVRSLTPSESAKPEGWLAKARRVSLTKGQTGQLDTVSALQPAGKSYSRTSLQSAERAGDSGSLGGTSAEYPMKVSL